MPGIHEHRYRSVRWFRTDDGAWRRFEPWMTTLVDLSTGQVLGIVDGRDSTAVGDWLAQRSELWRERIEIVAIDPSAAFRKALRTYLPRAAVSVDKFHLVKLGNDMVTTVRQRLARTHRGRRGRKDDPAWAHLMLLLRGADTLTPRAWERLETCSAPMTPPTSSPPPGASRSSSAAYWRPTPWLRPGRERMRMGYFVQIANMPEATKLYDTVVTWWDAIEVLIVTGATTARVEAANTGIKNIKRTGRGFRNAENYRMRILLTSAAKTVA